MQPTTTAPLAPRSARLRRRRVAQRGGLVELQGGEVCIEPAGCHQFAVPTALDQAALVDHQDAIGLQHRRQPVRDDQRAAAGHQPVECLLHHPFAFRIERRSRLVEQGIPAQRLAATGFGEFQPLDAGGDEISYRRNRRIEFKLTER